MRRGIVNIINEGADSVSVGPTQEMLALEEKAALVDTLSALVPSMTKKKSREGFASWKKKRSQ